MPTLKGEGQAVVAAFESFGPLVSASEVPSLVRSGKTVMSWGYGDEPDMFVAIEESDLWAFEGGREDPDVVDSWAPFRLRKTPWFLRDEDGNMSLPNEEQAQHLTVGQLTEIATSRGALGVFDYAIPQRWADDVKAKTGEWPFYFVWSYPAMSVFGMPFALTEEAVQLLAKYEELSR